MMVVGCGGSGGGEEEKGKKGKGKGKGKADAGGSEEGETAGSKMAKRFDEEVGPLLICKREVVLKAATVREMKTRASDMRKGLQDFYRLKGDKERAPPDGMVERYMEFVGDMISLLSNGEASGRRGSSGEVLDSKGDRMALPLNVDCLKMLEGFWDAEYGVIGQSVEYAYLLRDLFGGGKVEGAEAVEGA